MHGFVHRFGMHMHAFCGMHVHTRRKCEGCVRGGGHFFGKVRTSFLYIGNFCSRYASAFRRSVVRYALAYPAIQYGGYAYACRRVPQVFQRGYCMHMHSGCENKCMHMHTSRFPCWLHECMQMHTVRTVPGYAYAFPVGIAIIITWVVRITVCVTGTLQYPY